MSADAGAVQVGASATFTKTVSEADVYLYAGITGDFSPNHVDEVYMRAGRYGRRIAHGTLLVGFMSAASARLYLGRTVSLGYDRIRFTAPVYFGDTITTEYRIREIDTEKRRVYADLTCRNERGETVAAGVNVRAFVD
jgi:acyl dehydratase